MSEAALAVLVALAIPALLVIAGQIAEARRTPRTPRTPRTGRAQRMRGAAGPAKSGAPGRFHRLSEGRTHAEWTGPPDGRQGPVVVCVHGLSTPSAVWSPLAGWLAAAGWRVLRYDLYGRGLSDAPLRAHRAGFYARQLEDLLRAEGIEGPVPLIGYSMGGAIVAAFAEACPARCSGIALLAPAGLKHGLAGLYAVSARLPVVGDALWSILAPGMLRGKTRGAASDGLPELGRIIAGEVSRQGTLPAQLSSLRHILTDTMDDTHRRLAECGLPVLAIWGAKDDVIPLASRDRLARANPDAVQIVLPDAGHGLPFSHADRVAEALLDWARHGFARADGMSPAFGPESGPARPGPAA